MRILHILDHSIPLHSGYTFRTRSILQHQRARGWETFHLTSPKHRVNGALVETVEGIEFYRTAPSSLEKIPLLGHWAIVRAVAARLEEVIPQVKPDILHAHSPALNGLAAIRAGRRHRLPVVYECRAFWEDAAVDHGATREGSFRYRMTHALESYVFRHVDAVTTICEGLKQDIVGRGLPADTVTVIPNAVDCSRFAFGRAPDPVLRKELGLEGATVLGFIGSFYGYEGLPLLLRALPEIVRQVPEVRVLLVGGGPQEPQLRSMAREPAIGDRVIFTGRVPHDQVHKYYDLVDIFVYPRLPMRLTELVTPLKPLEAMARGRLVVASDVGGHRELIRDGETGQLFKAGDAEALARVIGEAVAQRESWPTLIQKARRFVEEERSWEASIARYQSVYTKVFDHGE